MGCLHELHLLQHLSKPKHHTAALYGDPDSRVLANERRKKLVDTGRSSRTWSVPTVSLRLAVLNVFQGFFGPKMAVFGPKLQFLKLRSATCESRSRPPPLSFSLKLCVMGTMAGEKLDLLDGASSVRWVLDGQG